MEALVVLLLLLLSSTLVVSDYCVCRSDQGTAVLQKAMDFACGEGADCSAILQNGACYNPNTVAAHCSWAANSYYQRNVGKGATCDFNGAATLSSSDPSYSGCTFPASASAAGTPSTPITGGTPGASSGTLTPSTGTGYGTNGTGLGSLGPTGTSSLDAGAVTDSLPRVELAAFLTVLSFLAFS